MGSPDNLLPFFFAWVDSDQTTFDPVTMSVVDEAIFDMDLQHEEGQTPTLSLTIVNPRIGLLAPTRKVWAWLSYQSPTGSGITPIFFGELIGIPSDLFAETITLKFISRAQTYIEDKQAVAETLKVAPYYDPVFLEETKRDDPDAILEGYSALYHIDRTSLVTTVSDILEGEDGVIVFTEDDAFYDSVKMTLDQSPLAQVQVQANVHWTQRWTGYVDGPNVNIASYTGDTFLADWPKPGTSLGGGWRVETSFVSDAYKVALTPQVNESSTWTNNETDLSDCSTQAIDDSASFPALLSPNPLSYILTEQSQTGICDPYGDPPDQPPINRPAKIKITGVIVPLWVLNCRWELRYEAKRSFTEDLFLNVAANTQSVLTSPTVQQSTELIKISGADVGEPIIVYDAWSDFANKPVAVAQLIFPNDPTTPGGLSYQVCVNAGTAGATEPTFSDIPGAITYDPDSGGVEWASLGENPESTIQQMTFDTSYDTGTILLYQSQYFDANTGGMVDIPGSYSYYICIRPAATTGAYTEMTYVPPVTDSDEPTPAPITISLEIFGPTSDMVNLGPTPAFLSIPVGGTADLVGARNYFPTDRGQQSIQYLISKARARIRMRSRAVKISWDCPFDLVLGMSCRHSATLYDPRLPGGVATGKVISYTMKASNGRMIGHVEIGCAVGYAGHVATSPGTPEYTAGTGYCLPGYQRYDGAVLALDPEVNDIGYTPPVFAPFDDGLAFPLAELPSDGGIISGSSGEQAAAIKAAFPVQRYLTNVGEQFTVTAGAAQDGNPGGSTGHATGFNATGEWWITEQQLYWTARSLPYVMEAHPVSWTIEIDPVTNGPFDGAYTVETTPLEIPMGINLEAPSSP